MRKKLGLIVNPIAGIGGRVGLKGSDGPQILKMALAMGAVPESPRRTQEALKRLRPAKGDIEIVTWPGSMGEQAAVVSGFIPTVMAAVLTEHTTPEDTEEAARTISTYGVDLLMFAGGDGTARNIFNAIGDAIPVLGIPAGVKIHSAVYANSPGSAGRLALNFLKSKGKRHVKDAEVMDIDEDAFRENRLSARLYGYLKVPYERSLIQSAKAGSQSNEEVTMDAIASDIITNMTDEHIYIIGSGTTTRAVMNKLGLPNTLLGIDAVFNKQLVGSDLNESRILELLKNRKGKIVVTVIGGQGHIFGRGNQQISPPVIQRVGKENIIVVATENKLLGLNGQPLLVDTGDPGVNQMLRGYAKVVVGLHKRIVYRVSY